MAANFQYQIERQDWPLKEAFVISRSSRSVMEIVTLTLFFGGDTLGEAVLVARGECQPNPRFHESGVAVCDALNAYLSGVTDIFAANPLALTSKAAQNALDCALWDLRSKHAGKRAWQLAGLKAPAPVGTFYTVSLGAPDAMADAAKRLYAAGYTRLKLKLGGPHERDRERMQAVRAALPDAELVVDANEAWDASGLPGMLEAAQACGVRFVEQPLKAGDDAVLAEIEHILPICADEALGPGVALSDLAGRYDMINIKLDKVGGLTPALKLKTEAEVAGLSVMVGCMVCTSLAAAPAILVAQGCVAADLDGPLLLARDRDHALTLSKGAYLGAPDVRLWG